MLDIQNFKPSVFQRWRAFWGGCLLGLAMLGTAPSHARTFTVDIEFGSIATEGDTYWEGSLTSALVIETAGDALSFEQVTGLSGTFDGLAVTGVLDSDTYQGNDNRMQNQAGGYTTGNGLSFQLENGSWVNLYSLTSTSVHAIYDSADLSQAFYATADSLDSEVGGRVSVAVNSISSVPEPATLALMLAGGTLVGVTRRHPGSPGPGSSTRHRVVPRYDGHGGGFVLAGSY